MPAQPGEKPLILHWIWSLSLGGDAKNLCALAAEQSKWGRVVIATRLQDQGVRAKELAGTPDVELVGGIDGPEQVESLCAKIGKVPLALIMHRNGRPDPVESRVLESFHRLMPCFEFSTFGRVDPATDELWAGHFFPSRSCLLQYAARRNVPVAELKRHWAVGYAVDLAARIEPEERQTARQKLGLAPADFVGVRLQRPDLRKWDPLPVLAVRRLLDRGERIRLIVQAPPPERIGWLKSMLGDAAIILAATDDAAVLRTSMAASDCFFNYSHIGETFGLAMVEAMSCGIPPLTNSTPHMDNAQIEICSHGETGLVANSVEALCAALERLIKDCDYRYSLGAAAREFVARTFSAPVVEQRVRRHLRDLEISAAKPEVSEEPQVSEVTQVSASDNYRMDGAWLNDLPARLLREQSFKARMGRQLLDAQLLRFLRAKDTFDYAAGIGPSEILSAIVRRVRRSSLKRD